MDIPWSDVINLFTGLGFVDIQYAILEFFTLVYWCSEWVATLVFGFHLNQNSMFVLFRDMVVEGAISKRLAGLELPHQ
jgi:hypothetical protein